MPIIPYIKNPTWADGSGGGTSIDAADLNKIEAGVFEAHQMPAVRVTHNAAQSIPTATDTALAFNTERFDQAGGASSTQHDTVTNNSRLTCQFAGIYLITGMVEWAADAAAASNRLIKIRVGGTTFIAEHQTRCATTIAIQLSIATIYSLAVNDFVELVVWHDKGSSLNISNTSNYSPEFGMVRVA